MNTLLIQAIQNKKRIRFVYGDSARIGEPYIYGKTKKRQELVLVYQTEKEGESTKPQGWRMLKFSEITSLEITDQNFSIREDYNPYDDTIREVFAKIH